MILKLRKIKKIRKLVDKICDLKQENIGDKNQIITVLKESLHEDELIEKIKKVEESLNEKIYTDNECCKKFGECDKNLKITTQKNHVIPNIGERIFNIRCGIVHGKEDYTGGLRIIPTPENSLLIEKELILFRWIAEEVILHASKWEL